MTGKCPKCEAESMITVQAIRAREEATMKTWPIVLFLCGQCRTILGASLDPDWQAQIVAGQLRTVGQGPGASH